MLRFTAALVLVALSSPAQALGFLETLMLQNALETHGFDVGKPDGRIGPATRSGAAAFSETYGAPSDLDGLFAFMLEQSRGAREDVTDPEVLDAVRLGVSNRLRDPESVRMRNVFSVVNGTSEIICGEVNGKNAYGAYAGFQTFYGMLVSVGDPVRHAFSPVAIDTSDSPLGFYTCALAFPKK